MSSPVLAPRSRRSVAGPVVLILLGIVFLLGTMGVIHWTGLAHLFARFWPVLLIVWGLIKLLEYQQAQREGTRVSGIGAGGVFLLIFLIVAGLAATEASRVNWGSLRDEIDIDDGDFTFFGQTFDYSDELAQPFPAGGTLRVVNDHGAVAVNFSEDNQIKVSVHKRIGADDQQTADKYNTQTKPQITVSGNTVTLNANTSGAGQHGVTSDLNVLLPRRAAVVISSKHGDINVAGGDGNVEVSNQHGGAVIDDIHGNVSLNLDHSSARVERVSGDVSVEGRANDVSLSDVQGSTHLSGEFMESVKLEKIAKGVSFKSSRTDMEFSRLDGELNLDSGDLRANTLVGPLRLITRAKDIRLEQVAGDVRLQDDNGAIDLQMSSLGELQIQNRRGAVQVTVPGKASFRVDARSHGGEIESDFSELKIEDANNVATAAGAVGQGGPHLQIDNEHGTIEIRRGSVVAASLPAPPAPPKAPRLPAPKSKSVQPAEN